MKRAYRYGRAVVSVCIAVAGAALAAGCGGSEVVAEGKGPWTVYPDPFMDAAKPNPAEKITGTAEARAEGEKTAFTLEVAGLPPNTTFGAHLHALPCDNNKAGGHYQHNKAPEGMANDPMYGNSTNEVWLDVTTDASGKGTAKTTFGWTIPEGAASSIVVHEKATAPGGVAGAKLACLPIAF